MIASHPPHLLKGDEADLVRRDTLGNDNETALQSRRRNNKKARPDKASQCIIGDAPSRHSAARWEARVTQLTQELHEAGEHQTATTDVLRIISSSQGELNAVFHAILANATKLCEASYGTLWLTEGDAFRVAAQYGALPAAYMERLRPGTLFRLGPHLPSVRAINTRRPVQVADLRLAQATSTASHWRLPPSN